MDSPAKVPKKIVLKIGNQKTQINYNPPAKVENYVRVGVFERHIFSSNNFLVTSVKKILFTFHSKKFCRQHTRTVIRKLSHIHSKLTHKILLLLTISIYKHPRHVRHAITLIFRVNIMPW